MCVGGGDGTSDHINIKQNPGYGQVTLHPAQTAYAPDERESEYYTNEGLGPHDNIYESVEDARAIPALSTSNPLYGIPLSENPAYTRCS